MDSAGYVEMCGNVLKMVCYPISDIAAFSLTPQRIADLPASWPAQSNENSAR